MQFLDGKISVIILAKHSMIKSALKKILLKSTYITDVPIFDAKQIEFGVKNTYKPQSKYLHGY